MTDTPGGKRRTELAPGDFLDTMSAGVRLGDSLSPVLTLTLNNSLAFRRA